MKPAICHKLSLALGVVLLMVNCHSIEELPPYTPYEQGKQTGDPTDHRYQALMACTLDAQQFSNEMIQDGFLLCRRVLDLRNGHGGRRPRREHEVVAADTLFYLTNSRSWVRMYSVPSGQVQSDVDTLQFIEADSTVKYPDSSRWTGLRLRMHRATTEQITGDSLSVWLDLIFSGDVANEGDLLASGRGAIRALRTLGAFTPGGSRLCQYELVQSAAITDLAVNFKQQAANASCPAAGMTAHQGTFGALCEPDSLNFSEAWLANIAIGAAGIAVTIENASTRWIDTVSCAEVSSSPILSEAIQ